MFKEYLSNFRVSWLRRIFLLLRISPVLATAKVIFYQIVFRKMHSMRPCRSCERILKKKIEGKYFFVFFSFFRNKNLERERNACDMRMMEISSVNSKSQI